MKKIDGKITGTHYQSVCLYRDDLDDIINLLSENTERVVISDSEYEYESIEDLKKNRGLKPKKLAINSYTPYISLEFKRDLPAIWLYRGDSGQNAIYLYESIVKILAKRRRLLFKIFNPSIAVILTIVFFSLAFFPSEYLKSVLPEMWQRLTFIVITLGIPIISWMGKFGAFYSLNLLKKHECGNFFQRQKDDLIKLLIGAIAGGVLTYIVTSISN